MVTITNLIQAIYLFLVTSKVILKDKNKVN